MNESNNYALTMAYEFVTKQLKWTHAKLNKEFGFNYATLARIRDGKPMKPCNYQFFFDFFVSIADEAYHKDLKRGGDHRHEFLHFFHDVLMAAVKERGQLT